MQQSNVLFDDTVLANITIGLEDGGETEVPHDEAAVKEACLTAQLWHDVPTLGGGLGLHAPVGYRGKVLTGGQAQRVCLARCLLRRTPILFLDEPASAQDDQTVQDLSEALGDLKSPPRVEGTIDLDAPEEETTVVAITHNTTLLKNFTHVIMMLHGRVVEYGAIEDLLRRKGHYYRLVMSRTGLSIDRKGNARCTPERLRQVWIFATAPLESLQTLTRRFVTRTLTTDESVYEKGGDADAMYFLVKGQIEATENATEDDSTDGKADGRRDGRRDGGDDEADGERRQGEGAAEAAADGDAEGGGGATAVRGGKRFVYMSGDDFGVEGLLDNTFRWSMHARVCSRKAVVLELAQADLTEILDADLPLNESAGEMLKQVQRLREPSSLALLWPFHGAPLASLQAVSMAMDPDVAFEDSILCEVPMDPCNALRVVVAGKVSLLRAAAPGTSGTSPDGQTESVSSGASFGLMEMLPAPAPRSAAEIILSKQSPVLRAKAVEFTVLLSLSRSKLQALSDAVPDFDRTHAANEPSPMCLHPPNDLSPVDRSLSGRIPNSARPSR